MTTAAQWEHMAREANAAAVKAMDEADRLRAELAERDEQLAYEQSAHDNTVGQRDFAHEWADTMAYTAFTEAEIGEHTSHNNPWENAADRLAALRAAGGQEKPKPCDDLIPQTEPRMYNADQWSGIGLTCELPSGHVGDHLSDASANKKRITWANPAAPVGGQAEPSDDPDVCVLTRHGYPHTAHRWDTTDVLNLRRECAGLAVAAVSNDQA